MNQTLNYLKREKRYVSNEAVIDNFPASHSHTKALEKEMEYDVIRELVEHITPEYRMVIILG